VLAGHGRDQFGVDEGMDQRIEGLRPQQSAVERRGQPGKPPEAGGVTSRVCLGEPAVPLGTEEGERRHERTSADTGDDFKFRPPRGLAQTNQHPSPEGPARGAARDSQDVAIGYRPGSRNTQSVRGGGEGRLDFIETQADVLEAWQLGGNPERRRRSGAATVASAAASAVLPPTRRCRPAKGR
jgi:hypothetical protein